MKSCGVQIWWAKATDKSKRKWDSMTSVPSGSLLAFAKVRAPSRSPAPLLSRRFFTALFTLEPVLRRRPWNSWDRRTIRTPASFTPVRLFIFLLFCLRPLPRALFEFRAILELCSFSSNATFSHLCKFRFFFRPSQFWLPKNIVSFLSKNKTTNLK